MRRILVATLLICSLGSLATAQVEYRKDDGTTDYTSRNGLANQSTGWMLEHWRVAEHLGGLQDIAGMVVVVQDQNCSTVETYQAGILNEFIDPTTGPTGTPDEANPPYITAQVNFPACSGGTPNVANAWVYTFNPTNPLLGPFTNDLFPGVLAPAANNWSSDGFSTHISYAGTGPAGPELPSQGAVALQNPPTPGAYPGANYTCYFDAGTGGGPTATQYPAWRIMVIRLQTNSHTGRSGSEDTTGFFAAQGTNVPNPNFGMAGAFPDATDQSGTAPQRFDKPIYRTDNSGLSGSATSFSMVLLSTGLARQSLGVPVGLPLPGIGDLELDPTDPLFNAMLGGLSGNLGLLVPNMPVAPATYTDIPFDVDLLGIRWVFNPPISLFGQIVDFDLATGGVSLSTLFQADYM